MADVLSESTWTGFTKKSKLGLDDAALVKALARFDKTSEAKPEPRLEALTAVVDEIKKQVTSLAKRKKDLGDKTFNEVKDKLYALLGSAEGLQKDAQKAVEAAGDAADEEEESPALLTTKMIPLLREVRKGELVLQALIAVAGKETVVLLQRKAISVARGKLLKEQMSNPSGLKFIRGDCRFEQNTLTFVVQAPAAGLAKKVKQALLAQTDLRLKVRVRGDAGDDDFEDELEGDGAVAGGEVPLAPPLAPDKPAAVDPAVAFNARLTALMPALKGALPEVRAKASEAGFAARKRSFDDANALLDDAERMLGAAGAGAGSAGGETVQQIMERWKAQRTQAIGSLKAVAAKIASAKHAQSAKAILEIQAVIKNITAEPSTLQQVTELQHYLGSDDIVNDVCELAEDIRTPLLRVLSDLRTQVA